MNIEVELRPVVTVEELLGLARIADEAGVSRLGISDVALFRNSFKIQALCAAATSNVLIGSLVTNPYVRHPAVAAAAVGTLNEVSHGRAFLGIGQPRPVRRLEEFLRAVQARLGGNPVNLDGPASRFGAPRFGRTSQRLSP